MLIDEEYESEHEIRKALFRKKRNEILGCKPVARAACEELLEEVVHELLEVYPNKFELLFTEHEARQVKDIETSELYQIDSPTSGAGRLKMAATLAMEDFNILMQDEGGLHKL